MQKKCKKMQKSLHISKKSSIFAPDLGIVPTITLKKGKDMKELCIFKAWGGKNMHRVCVRKNEDGGFYYVYYIGRKLAPTIAKWAMVNDAVNSAITGARLEMEKVFEYRFEL